MSDQIVQFAYLASAVLLIVGMQNLASPRTAPRGNWIAAAGMAVAIVFATINVVGGFLVTDRMLGMFKRKPGSVPRRS